MADLVGESLGPYTITERIGRGGMADVYKAFHTSLSVHRAVKVVRPEFVTSDDFRARFLKEAQAVAQLRHPNIVQVHDFGTHGSAYYMVMEFIEGSDLRKVLAAEGSIRPIRRAAELVLRVAGALEYAHGRGLIHRDIKPDNVMITPSGQPILTDFGIAKLVTSSTKLTQTGFGIGTPAYMSPEQAQGGTEVGPEADIYALSVVLFELLTGRVPFDADTPVAVMLKAISDPLPMPRALNPDISEALQAVIIKGAAKSPVDRYATVADFSTALQRALDAPEPATTHVPSPPSHATTIRVDPLPPARRRTTAWLIGAAALLAVIGGSYLWISREAPPTAVNNPPPIQTPAPIEPATVIAAGNLAFDRPIVGKTEHAGQRVEYTFDGAAGDTVYFDHGHSTSTTRFVLFAPDGARVLEATSDDGPRTLPQTGRYRLSAEPSGAVATEFEFALWRLVEPAIDGGKIGTNVLVEGHTGVPGQVERFSIDAKAGQQLSFALDQSSEATDFKLMDPAGVKEIFAADRDAGPVELPSTGSYTLIADPRFDKPSRFAFVLRSPVQGRAAEIEKPAAKVASGPVAKPAQPPAVDADAAHPNPPTVATEAPALALTPEPAPSPPAKTDTAASGGLDQVTKGVTTQSDLLKRFGGPNLTTFDKQGRETWVYERTVTQTDTRSATNVASGGVDFSAFWSAGAAGASASASKSATTLRTGSSIRTLTVVVTFAADRTVLDYTVKETYF